MIVFVVLVVFVMFMMFMVFAVFVVFVVFVVIVVFLVALWGTRFERRLRHFLQVVLVPNLRFESCPVTIWVLMISPSEINRPPRPAA